MVHNIYFSVCGEGYGHSSRDMAIARILTSAGAHVLMGSYGYVLDRLKINFDCIEIEKEFEMKARDGAFDLKATISQSKNSILHYSRIISQEKKIMEDFSATCAVADGRSAAVFAAFKLGIPCIVISNQTSIESFFKESKILLNLVGKPVDLTLKTTMALAEEVLIPDLPPPFTVCINTLSKSQHVMKKQRFIGPVVSAKFSNSRHPIPPGISSPFVLTVLSGHSFSLPIFNGILKIADRFPEINFLIFAKFKSDSIPKNARVLGFSDDISPYMVAAELIIAQAGHSTAMEILTLGKPALIIPIKGQVEQEYNAKRMKELGMCETLNYESFNGEELCEKIHLLLNEKKFKEKAVQYSEMTGQMNGSQKAAEIILELSNRIQCY
jgi:UDP-N-acetylglucosamine--N-acetylmuramyl-(pentapeptide) pyrophosphoryl-undecaprenol N-acetylglucosamine transferase